MPIEIELHGREIVFKVSGVHGKQLTKWKNSVDERVFKQELQTGLSPKGRELDEGWLKAAKMAQETGVKIPPWYGVSQGAYVYEFQETEMGPILSCENTETGDSLELSNEHASLQEIGNINNEIIFRIKKKQLKPVSKWINWLSWKKIKQKYVFEFVPTTVGCIFNVRDLKTGISTDITDYSDW